MANEARPISHGHDLGEGLGRGGQQEEAATDAAGEGEPGQMPGAGGPGRRSSGRDPEMDPTLPNTRDTVLVTLAITGGRPRASRAG